MRYLLTFLTLIISIFSFSLMAQTTYLWSNGSTTPTIDVNPIQTTTYYVTITDNGMIYQDSLVVYVNAAQVSAGVDQTICAGSAATLTATGADTYTWTPAVTTSDSTGALTTVNPTSTTSYVVIGTNADGCAGSDTVVVSINNIPPISAGPDMLICLGDSSLLSAIGGSSYSWDNGLGSGNNIAVSPNVITTYVVSGTDSFGCVGLDSVVVSPAQFTAPIITTTPSDSALCNGTGNVTLDPSGSFTVEWSNGSQGVNGIDLCPGSVLVVATENTYGCVYTQYGFVDQVGSIYPLSVQLSVQDASEDGLCDGSAQFFAYGGVTPYNYELYDANNTLVGSSENAGSLCSGVYQLILSDAVSNTDSIQFYIAEPSNFYSNVVISVDSAIMDTLVTNVLEECVIDFATVDSAWISAVNYINADTLVVTWVVQDATGIHYVDQSYVITNFIGNYVIELSLFCPGKAPGDPYLKILSSLYVDYNSSSSGIDEWKDDKLIIYPNPSSDVIYIKSTGVDLRRVILYDAQGKQIATEIQYFGDKVMLELPKPSGNYLIKIETLDGSYIRRVIKSQD